MENFEIILRAGLVIFIIMFIFATLIILYYASVFETYLKKNLPKKYKDITSDGKFGVGVFNPFRTLTYVMTSKDTDISDVKMFKIRLRLGYLGIVLSGMSIGLCYFLLESYLQYQSTL